jgi:type IV pilus assembly protein PilX
MRVSFTAQSGAVLVVSLIMLLLLTLIGVAAIQVASLEEKMAYNSRDKNLAFQAAEAALRGAEQEIEGLPSIASFNGSNHWLIAEDAVMPPLFEHRGSLSTVTWNNADSFEFEADMTEINSQPRYFIKYIGDNAAANINNCSYGSSCGEIVSYFIVTARGTGAQNTSQSFLRLYYARTFN